MANCHDLFRKYLESIRLKQPKRSSLKTSRDANRERIRKHFREVLKRPVPKFHGQGSYMMHTGINPLVDEYDVDDGVYLQGLGTDPSQWPSAETVHQWIVDATKGYTSAPPQDKAKCVRVRYSGDYHVDLPSYAMNAAGVPMLFEKGKAPYESDPRAFTDWFQEKVAEDAQVRDLVRYLKGWRDYQQGATCILKGIAITILIRERFQADDRDDVALVSVARKIYNHLQAGGRIYKPATPYEDLTAGWTAAQRSALVAKLKTLVDEGQRALDENSRAAASKIWRDLLGDRFPVVEAEEQEASAKSRAALVAVYSGLERTATHTQRPPWPIQPLYSVRLDAYVYRGQPGRGVKLGGLNSDGRTIPSGLWLKFVARTPAPAGCEFYWQVVNTGAHAARAGGLRGQIFSGSSVQSEQTLYTGRHWIECFLVRNGGCIGRSARFYVNIENPDYPLK